MSSTDGDGGGAAEGIPQGLIDIIKARILLWMVVLVVVGSALVLLSFYATGFRDPDVHVPTFLLRSLGAGILVAGGGTGLVRFFLVRNYEQFRDAASKVLEARLTGMLGQIEQDVRAQAVSLYNGAASLQALGEEHVSRVYPGRIQASIDIERELTDPDVSSIYLMGVSLNDLMRGGQATRLDETWSALHGYIQNGRSATGASSEPNQLNIRLMVVDPYSLGAQLRAKGESRKLTHTAGQLEADVINTVQKLAELEDISRARFHTTGVLLECKMYRTTPTFFICQTERATYLQPYCMWAKRHADGSGPVLKYDAASGPGDPSVHEEMKEHFDWLWEKAAISLKEFLQGAVGYDRGLSQSGVTNVFSEFDLAGRGLRIQTLLGNVQSSVDILGNSLHSFFRPDEKFADGMFKLARQNGVRIRVLCLDPRCEQAEYRAYREHLFEEPGISLDAFHEKGLLLKTRLFQDTNVTLRHLALLMEQCEEGMLDVRLHTSATCFLLIVDDTVALAEQYLNGSSRYSGEMMGNRPTLGTDMPLIEYSRITTKLYEASERRTTFNVLRDHFDFVFDCCSKPFVPSDYM